LTLLRIAGLCAFIAVLIAAFQRFLLPYFPALNLFDNHGRGQILLYTLVLITIVLYLRLARSTPEGTKEGYHSLSRPLRAYLRQPRRTAAGFGLGVLASLAGTLLCYGILFANGVLTWDHVGIAHFTPWVAIQSLLSLLVVPVLATTEELIFRAFLFDHLYTGQKTPAGAALSVLVASLIFAVVHHFRNLADWLSPQNAPLFLTLTLLGALLCLTYLASNSLACSIGVHTGFLLPEVFRSHSHLMLLHQDLWWTGGNKDLRTSPLTWLLMLAIGLLLWRFHRWLNTIARIDDNRRAADRSPVPMDLIQEGEPAI